MKFMKFAAALACLAAAAPSHAVIQSAAFTIRASDFGYDFSQSNNLVDFKPPPIDSVELDFTLTLDDTLYYDDATSGLTITNFNVPTISSAFSFKYVPAAPFQEPILIIASHMPSAPSPTFTSCLWEAPNSVCFGIQSPFSGSPVLFFAGQGTASGERWVPATTSIGTEPFSATEPGGSTVPEPASWALLIAGFGMVGASLRRQRARVAA